MSDIHVLDCTLRDGGRIINCAFKNQMITDIARELTRANINIVEMGFLRSEELVDYKGDSTFFTSTKQIEAFIPEEHEETMYVAFTDFGMYDFEKLEECNGKSVTGIRFGFTKKQFDTRREELLECMDIIKRRGYQLFVQGVNSLAYKDRELLDLIDMLNQIQPFSFGIVDTYGAMYVDDMVHFYNLVDYNLDKNIWIDIHTHNNFQLAFALAQEIVILSAHKRNIIIDATLNGMGKCAGNLNTELIVDYLVRKKNANYQFDIILDIIDNYLYDIKQQCSWGYSVPAFMAGIYKAHPNNIIYLTEKFRLNTKDIKNIIAMIDEDTRQHYDYDKIESLYIKYNEQYLGDNQTMAQLKQKLLRKKVLFLVPGNTLNSEKDKIEQYINREHPIIFSVNFVPKYEGAYVFWGNPKRYELMNIQNDETHVDIICSNVRKQGEGLQIVDYHDLIFDGYKYFDNSAMMCLNLLKNLELESIVIAGFDGFDYQKNNNYMNDSFPNGRYVNEFDEINDELERMLTEYFSMVKASCDISFLTESRFKKVLPRKNSEGKSR